MILQSARARLLYTTFAGLLAVSLIPMQGCKPTVSRNVYDMGEKVRVGALTYTVLESSWKSQLGDSFSARVPEQNFLLVRVSATNSGGKVANIPTFTLENSRGDSFAEVQDGKGVDGWLGIFRNLNPTATEDGWILFDVPTNAYQLKISDPEAADLEAGAFVKIPLKLAD